MFATLGLRRLMAFSPAAACPRQLVLLGTKKTKPFESLGGVRTLMGARRRNAKALRQLLQSKPTDRVPTIDMVSSMPLLPQEMDNSTLVTLGSMGNHEARKEIVKRHVMTKDKVSYEEACEIFRKIQDKNSEFTTLLSLPYRIGIAVALTGGFLSFPMVFDLSTAEWFNTHFVTTDVPEPHDLETSLEVGSWTWNWMEPILGQVSFFLLCLQFSRSQIQNLGVRPYTDQVKLWRGKRLADAFPQYDSRVLIAYSETATLYRSKSE